MDNTKIPHTDTLNSPHTQKFVQEYNNQIPTLSYVQAKAKLEYQSGKEKLNSTVIIRSRYDSVLWVSVIPVLGIEAARIKITRDTLYVMDKINHTVTISSVRKIEEKLGAKITLNELQNTMFGLNPIPNKIQKIKQDKTFYLVSALQNNIDYTFQIQKSMLLHSLFLKEKQNGYTSIFYYLNYVDVPLQGKTIKLPHYLTASIQTKQNIQAQLTYTKINLNPEKLSTPFEFSKNFKVLYE